MLNPDYDSSMKQKDTNTQNVLGSNSLCLTKLLSASSPISPTLVSETAKRFYVRSSSGWSRCNNEENMLKGFKNYEKIENIIPIKKKFKIYNNSKEVISLEMCKHFQWFFEEIE